MMAYQQHYSQQAYSRHAAANTVRPSYPSIATQATAYPPSESYYQPATSYDIQQMPPAHVLQYFSPPLHARPSPTGSYPSSASSTSRHSTQSYASSQSPYSQPSPYILPSRPSARAVIIGINYFNQKGELRQSCRDARNLFTYLTQIKGFNKRDVILLTDDQNGVFGQPTRKNILDALSWVGENAERGEKVVIYYSGHGKVAAQGKKGKAPSKSSRGGRHGEEKEGAMAEGETIYPVDFRSFPRGMITPEELEERLKPAQRRGVKLTVILDTHAAVA
jgi:metacaspase-1